MLSLALIVGSATTAGAAPPPGCVERSYIPSLNPGLLANRNGSTIHLQKLSSSKIRVWVNRQHAGDFTPPVVFPGGRIGVLSKTTYRTINGRVQVVVTQFLRVCDPTWTIRY